MTVEPAILKQVYEQLGVDTSNLGCIMLDTEVLKVSDIIKEDELYYSDEGQYTQGVVSEEVPHVTLLYGLMKSGHVYKDQVDLVLSGWSVTDVTVAEVDYFEPNGDEQYFTIIAKLDITTELLEGNARLRTLPHIDMFPDYQAHITLAYIKQDEKVLAEILYALNVRFKGKQIQVMGLNYGD